MDFHGTKKLLQMVSHDLWAQNRNIVFRGILNVCFQKIFIPPPPPPHTHTEDSLICTPNPQDFPFQGVFDDPLPPGGFKQGLH